MNLMKMWLFLAALALTLPAHAEKITVAVAANFKSAMDGIVTSFEQANPGDEVQVIYGASGKFSTQIRQGAPYDLFFSADMAFPRALAESGLAASEVRLYALGRIVLWSPSMDASKMTLESLRDARITRISMANPRHAPYGQRAEEALRASGVWPQIERKLIYGESIAHAAQFVQSGNAQVGIVALAQAVHPELAEMGGYWLIPENLHQPLEQGFIITKRAAGNALAQRFAEFIGSQLARATMTKYGFVVPDGSSGNE